MVDNSGRDDLREGLGNISCKQTSSHEPGVCRIFILLHPVSGTKPASHMATILLRGTELRVSAGSRFPSEPLNL